MPPTETAWWGDRTKLSDRFRLEVQAMKGQFGTSWKLILPAPEATDPMYWKGQVIVNMAEIPEDKRLHTLHVVYPQGYPNEAAQCYCVDPVIKHGGHSYGPSMLAVNKGAGRMCLFNPDEGREYGWNPARSHALTIALWGIQWLYGYYCWTYNGRWPGDEHNTRAVDDGLSSADDQIVLPNRRLSPQERLNLMGAHLGRRNNDFTVSDE